MLSLRSGRWPERVAELEAVVSERFAQVRGLHAGSTVVALLNGRRERVHIAGTVLSPEYVYATRGGAPDDPWFGFFWIDGERLATAYDMQGAFNRVALRQALAPASRTSLPTWTACWNPMAALLPRAGTNSCPMRS